MKPKLTLLLSLTFLFLCSGSVYGGVIDETIDGVFDRKGKGVGLYCKNTSHIGYPRNFYMFISLRDKVIKVDTRKLIYLDEHYYETYKIVGENELYIKGQKTEKGKVIKEGKKTKEGEVIYVPIIMITKHKYENNLIRVRYDSHNYECDIGEKVF